MNARIQELMLQAITDVDKIYLPVENPLNEEVSNMYIPDVFAERFAELIVKECATAIINDSRLNDVRSAANGCVRTIKEHFGVE